jgi:hypothetical protein
MASSPAFLQTRLPAILERLAAETDAGAIGWESAAPPDAYAVTIGDVRFRVRSIGGDGESPYVLEFLSTGQLPPPAPALVTTPDLGEPLIGLVTRLYVGARTSVLGDLPDPFESVERALDLETG